ncbi:uncharacterized protein [Typha latifolia]|uniref:uncharacterized protein n=1 Tax=Typha latifolia TaxID=4733 RepID=UPI003C2AB8A4
MALIFFLSLLLFFVTGEVSPFFTASSLPLLTQTPPQAAGSGVPPPPEELHKALLAPILSNLGFQELAMAVPALSSPVLSSWSGPLTLFAPSDDSLRSCPSCSPLRLLRDHLVPGLFPFPSLSTLPFASKLVTASPGRCLTVTSTASHDNSTTTTSSSSPASVVKIFVDGVEITRPDLFNDGRFVIHGIQGFIAQLSPLSCVHLSRPSSSSSTAVRPDRAGATGPGVVPFMIRDAIVRLRESGFGILALAIKVKYPVLAALSNMTIFALDDPAIFAGGHAYLTEVRFHVVPDRLLTHDDLLRLPTGTILPTLVRGQYLVVTHGSGSPGAIGSGLRINYVPIKVPDVVNNSRVAVHSVCMPFPHLYLADHATLTTTPAEDRIQADASNNNVTCSASLGNDECAKAPSAAPAASLAVDFMDDGL